MKDPTFSGQ